MEGKKLNIIVGIFVVLVIVLISYFLLSDSNKEPSIQVKDYYKQNFITACARDNGQYSYCSCAFDKIMSKSGINGLLNIGVEYNSTGRLNDEAMEAVKSCNYLYQN